MSEFRSTAFNPSKDKSELNVKFAGHHRTGSRHFVGPKVLNNCYLLHYVIFGKGQFTCGGKTFEVGAGECFVIFPGVQVHYVSDSEHPWFYRWIGFDGYYAEILLRKLSLSPKQPVFRVPNPRQTETTMAWIQSTLDKGLRGCSIETNGLMRLLVSGWMNGVEEERGELPEPSRQAVEQAIRWLSAHYADPVSIDQLARELGYHRVYFTKVFKKQAGLSPSSYLHMLRMERAKMLLGEPLTIKQVAHSVGYNDALFFFRQFKKWSGLSPSEYRVRRLADTGSP